MRRLVDEPGRRAPENIDEHGARQTARIMAASIGTEIIEELWHSFKSRDQSGDDAITLEDLRKVMLSLGHQPTDEELRHILLDADADGSITFDKFVALVASLLGDVESRLRVAFDVFDENGDGVITPDEMRDILGRFGMTEAELTQIFTEADQDGDGAIDFDEFCSVMPREHEQAANRYRASPIPFASSLRQETAPIPENQPAAATSQSTVEKRDHRLSAHSDTEHARGTSRLQMQISLFRLLQGAAYRCFRENYCANNETHLRAKKLPYTILHFADFVDKAIALYKALDVVKPACVPVLDAVTDSINAEVSRLQDRIANWEALDKNPEMLATASEMQRQRLQATTIHEKFAAGVEFALTLRKKNLGLADLVEDMLATHELNRLRRLELHQEMAPPPVHDGADPKEYLNVWNHVLLNTADEEIDGAMVPAAYWYEDFMPSLLAACSVGTADDLAGNTTPDETALDQWFTATQASGEFTRYGADVAEQFQNCNPRQKLAVRQAWRLTRHYLNGVQKRRERQDFGRDSGFLSQYAAFLDVHLGRSDVRHAQMRVSFPYFIGPAVWRFFHTAAEIVCRRSADQQRPLIRLFKDFFRLFATMYPCPYCRYHLNTFVVRNREVEMYPIEYLIHGLDPDRGDLQVSMEDKLAAITDGPSFRMFLWKLHNSVSSSITRTEPWYHLDDKAFYTTRHWPSLDSELARSRALNHDSIPIDRLSRIYGLLKPAAQLGAIRRDLQTMLQANEFTGLTATHSEARTAVDDLEAALAAGRFLQQTYHFDPHLKDDAPHFTPEEEDFGRSGVFVED